MKNLLTLFVVWSSVPFANAEWSKRVIEDHFDPLVVISATTEINTPNPTWLLSFAAQEGRDEIAFSLYNPGTLSSLVCSLEGITVKSKVDDVLEPVEIHSTEDGGVFINDASRWHQIISSANHLRVRITDRCYEDIDLEFDVSGTPDLNPLHPP